MGKFVDKIRRKLGLQPERTVTLTGKIPNKVTVNRSVEEQTGGAGGYPYYSIPTPANRPQLGDPKIDIGMDNNLKSLDKNNQLKRRKSLKLFRAFREDSWPSTAIDSTVPTAYSNPSTPIPTVPAKKKIKSFKSMSEGIDDGYDSPNSDTECGCLSRGARVIIKKDGYNARGNVDYYDTQSKKYVVSVDGGHNLILDRDDIEQIQENSCGMKPHKTPEEIAKKHGVSLEDILNQLDLGIKIESEHTDNHNIARNIALQHLDELPNYYSKLKKIEKGIKEQVHSILYK